MRCPGYKRRISMEKALNVYLDKMEKYLRPISASERLDIISEIRSEMQELSDSGVPAVNIIERLGDPKELARAYLGDLLTKESRFTWRRFLIVCAFYGGVGFSGMVVIPCLGIIAPTFIICGVATPLLGAFKMIDYLFALHIPYAQNIGIVLAGLVEFNPIFEFIISLFVGVLIFLAGRGAWRLLLFYCRKVSRAANRLSI